LVLPVWYPVLVAVHKITLQYTELGVACTPLVVQLSSILNSNGGCAQ